MTVERVLVELEREALPRERAALERERSDLAQQRVVPRRPSLRQLRAEDGRNRKRQARGAAS